MLPLLTVHQLHTDADKCTALLCYLLGAYRTLKVVFHDFPGQIESSLTVDNDNVCKRQKHVHGIPGLSRPGKFEF